MSLKALFDFSHCKKNVIFQKVDSSTLKYDETHWFYDKAQ